MLYGVEGVIEYLLGMQFKANAQLPSEHDLAKQFGLSRYDIRKAYDRFDKMGYVRTEQGKGRYYKGQPEKIEILLKGSDSFSEKMAQQGHSLETTLIEATCCDHLHSLRARMGLDSGAHLYRISRLRTINKEPAALHTSFVSDGIFPDLADAMVEITSMFAYYRSKGFMDFYYEESTLESFLPTESQRQLLQSPSLVPVMQLQSQCFDLATKQLLEVTRILYRADRFICRISPSKPQKPQKNL